MNDLEAMKALIEGKKITAQGLEKDQYLHLLDGTLYWEDGTEGDCIICEYCSEHADEI